MTVFRQFLIFFLVFSLLFSSGAWASEDDKANQEATESAMPVNSFELFWPISAGKVAGEQFYFLKTFKEDVRELFLFSLPKKADYNVMLSEKRTVEAEKLYLDKRDYENGLKTLSSAQEKREKAMRHIRGMEDKNINSASVKSRLSTSLMKQKSLLRYITSQLSDGQNSVLGNSLIEVDTLLSELQ